jgi:hypothetical protein
VVHAIDDVLVSALAAQFLDPREKLVLAWKQRSGSFRA